MRSSPPGKVAASDPRLVARSLDALNFLLADVRGGLGPYLNVFLVTQQHWAQADIGVVTTLGGWVALALQTPIGAAIDQTRRKRGVVIVSVAALAVGGAVIWAIPTFWPVMIANLLTSIVGDVFGPAVAALTLGLVGKELLARRMGRNSAWDHAGNLAIAIVAGAIGKLFSRRAVFLLVPLFAILAGLAVLSIPAKAIDYHRARGLNVAAPNGSVPGNWRGLVQCRPLVVLMVCAALYHLANAPLLPLVGQKLA